MKKNSVMHLENGRMPVATPESVGVKSESIQAFFDAVKQENIPLHSIQIVRHGKLICDAVAKPYTHESFHRIFSAAKGVVATAVLLCIQDGLFGIDDPVLPLLPKEDLPEDLDPGWQKLTVYHLLTMTDGHMEDAFFKMYSGSTCWTRTFFEVPLACEPGTQFCYDMGAQYIMNEIVAGATGKDLGTFMKERVWDKIGANVKWRYTEPEGHFFSSSIEMQPDGLTRMALLYLQEGEWDGEQIIDRELMEFAALPQGPSTIAYTCGITEETLDDIAGYGLHMWRNTSGGYRFCGGQGQLGIIYPEYDMAVSTLAALDDCDRIDELFDRYVLHKCWARPQKVNEFAAKKLARTIRNFTMGVPDASDCSSTAAKVFGKTYAFAENKIGLKTVCFEFDEDRAVIRTTADNGEKTFAVGLRDEWAANKGYIMSDHEDGWLPDLDRNHTYDTMDTLATGGWASKDCFEFVVRGNAINCEFRFFCTFDGNDLEVNARTTEHKPPVAFMGESSDKPGYDLYASVK